MAQPSVAEPFPVFRVAHRYLLYDINTVTYARREHHITGVLVGGLPQAPQQNVFLGIPLELMPEEARLLVEKGVAYIVDDVSAHRTSFLANGLSGDEKKAFLDSVSRQGAEAARKQQKAAGDRKMDALRKIAEKKGASTTENWNDIPDDMFAPRPNKAKGKKGKPADAKEGAGVGDGEDDETLFGSASLPASSVPPSITSELQVEEAHKITPTTSYPPLSSKPPEPGQSLPLPPVSQSYPLFKHLHEKDYFMSPGLRFGCQYTAYPGDPLRYHSHFLCNGMEWDQEFDLLDLVGGGRLGTGVKKGFLIGGEEKPLAQSQRDESVQGKEGPVRAFCIEWGGM